MGIIARLLRNAVVIAGLACGIQPACAAPDIEISFEDGAADSQRLVRARAVFPVTRSSAYRVFSSISAYPDLHEWIRATKPVDSDGETCEFLVEFSFPWPVGKKWSRVEVRHTGNRIQWKQIDGNLKANAGHISFTAENGRVRIDYRAAIDIGLPESWTLAYKKKFVREFMTAAFEKAREVDAEPTLVLASGQ